MQSSRIIQSSKRLLFAAPFLAILVPLFFTLSIRSQPSLVSPSGDSPLIAYVHECMTPGFWMNMIGEGTFYGHLLSSPKYQIGVLLIFQSLACVVITLLLLWSTLYCKKSYLAPFTVAYALMSALIFLATMGDSIIIQGVMQYAGITIEDMHSDWKSNLCYIPETDCFYTFTSDFGPGAFNPSYGEKSGAIVTLWGASSCNEGPAVLTLQKNGNGWLIRSFQAI